MNDLAALVAARCEVLYLEPAAGDTVKLYWPRAGESFALYFTLPGELPMLAALLRTIGVERLHFHHVHLLPRAILELPVGRRRSLRLHAARLLSRSVRNTTWSPRTGATAASPMRPAAPHA